MTALGPIRRGRRAAERRMLDTCRIRPVLGVEYDPEQHRDVPVYGEPVYEGRCKLQRPRASLPTTPDAGEHRWTLAPLELHLPVDGTAAVSTGHTVELTASVDPANVGRVFRIRDDDRKSLQTAIRFAIEEVTD